MRYAVRNVDLRGTTIADGDKVYALTGPANRDPRAFDDPDRFDLDRPARENKHVSFGYGIHLCIGAALARMETRIAVDVLLRRLPAIELVDAGAVRFTGFRNRSPEALLVRFRPS